MKHHPKAASVVALVLAAGILGALALAPAEGAFPGVNGKLALASDRDGNFEIYVMNADGSAQTRLTNDPNSDSVPKWSPDGQKLAFRSERDGNAEVYVMNADGSGLTNLTNNPAADGSAAWSPDGQKLAFGSNRDGNGEIYVMNADGSAQTRLTNDPAQFDAVPVWSPDGQKIAFHSNRDGNFEVYVMNPDGSAQTRLTNDPAIDGFTEWSPDGQKLAFESERDGNREIYVMNPDGSAQTRLTTNAAIDGCAGWSPDGQKLAFCSDRDGNFEIYAMNADGSGVTRLTTEPNRDGDPDWQPLQPDTTPPETTIISGPTDPTDDPTPTFELASSEPGSSFECRLDGGAFGQCSSPVTTSDLQSAQHSFEARATDPAGNTDPTPASRTFTLADPPPPPPQLGSSANLAHVDGEVFVRLPDGTRFRLSGAEQIPLGSVIDARLGSVKLTVATDRPGKTQSGEFSGGIFQVLQASRGLTELRLKGGDFRRCRRARRGKRRRRASGARRRLSSATVRLLRADARGSFRTRGRHSSATVRGTIWITADRCDGTLTTVKRGKVVTRDFRRRKSVVVGAGKLYLAQAPL